MGGQPFRQAMTRWIRGLIPLFDVVSWCGFHGARGIHMVFCKGHGSMQGGWRGLGAEVGR